MPRIAAAEPLPMGRGFLITEWLDGRLAVAATDTEALIEASRAMRRFHRVTGPGYGRVDVAAGAARGRHHSWAAFINGILPGIDDLFQHDVVSAAVAHRLEGAVADHREFISYRGEGVLLHCDLKPAHLFAADGRLAAIIDWVTPLTVIRAGTWPGSGIPATPCLPQSWMATYAKIKSSKVPSSGRP